MSFKRIVDTAALATGFTLGKKNPAVRDLALPKKNPAPEHPIENLLAWKAPGVNPHLLVAYKPGTDPTNPTNLVSVRVRSNKNFMPHMPLRARLCAGTIYDLEGLPPRFKGRW